MPIELTTPLSHDPGHGKPIEIYAHVKIVDIRMRIEKRKLTLTCNYGNKEPDGSWSGGKTHPRVILIQNTPPIPGPPEVPADPAYDTLMATTFASSTSNPLYAEVAASLYTWLLETDDPEKDPGEKYYEGTVI